MLKSGTDFREFSKVSIEFKSGGDFTVDIQRIPVTKDYDEDPDLKKELEPFKGKPSTF